LSREGARYAIVHSEDSDAVTKVENRILQIAPDYIKNVLSISITFSNPSSRRNGDVNVDIEADVAALTPVVGMFEPNQTKTITSGCVMKVE
jgi:hypothetical protein